MSTSGKRLSLSHPGVIATVVVMMVVVVVLNIRTFGPKGPRQRAVEPEAAATGGGSSAVPLDLNQVLARSAGAGMTVATGTWGDTPGVSRDPFRKRKAARSVTTTTSRPARARKTAPDTLVCSAVMLGGRQPVALIDGRPVAIGDRVHGCRVVRIATEGAWLRNARGVDVFLGVGEHRDSKKAFRMITDVPDRRDLGSTALEENGK